MVAEDFTAEEAAPTGAEEDLEVEDFTEEVRSGAAGFTAGADSVAEWDSAAAPGSVVDWDFVEERLAAAFAVTGSAAAGACADAVGAGVGIGDGA